MDDETIQAIIEQFEKINAIDSYELLVEDNYIFIPSIELKRDKSGKWVTNS